ncbi:MAG: formimidoylglutamase [Bdellovibrionales bacterium]|nr:formimidoylglutamase [Bdellovibrionales bacterium]
MSFLKVENDFILKKNDPTDLRLGDIYNQTTLAQCPIVLAGYPDDEGIILNGGRKGAALGPNTIRKYLSKMTPNRAINDFPKFYDIGNLNIENDLEHRHEEVIKICHSFLNQSKKWISLGGGHDYGYPDGAAFLKTYKQSQPVVINFDAHLDVRPTDKGITSGTPFYRLLNEFNNFDFFEIGIQEQCNSFAQRQWCQDMGGKILTFNELYDSKSSPVQNFMTFLKGVANTHRPTFVSLDIDVFSASHAMGCSQSWPLGITAHDFLLFFEYIISSFDVRALGIYEVSPPLDLDDRTSKLAAQIIYRFLQNG